MGGTATAPATSAGSGLSVTAKQVTTGGRLPSSWPSRGPGRSTTRRVPPLTTALIAQTTTAVTTTGEPTAPPWTRPTSRPGRLWIQYALLLSASHTSSTETRPAAEGTDTASENQARQNF